MSLKHAAQYLASHGRGADSMLMHVAPDEVARLQAAAQAQGGSLSVNPHTGLPEADFFSDLNPFNPSSAISKSGLAPILETVALNAIGVPDIGLGAYNSAAIVGGVNALATGSLQKGLMAGLQAYGTSGLQEAATGEIAKQEAIKKAATNFPELIEGAPASTNLVPTELTKGEAFKAGLKGIAGLGVKDLAKFGLPAVAPVMMAADQRKQGLPTTPAASDAYVNPKYYDYRTQRYYDLPAVKVSDLGGKSLDQYRSQFGLASDYPSRSAKGGLQDAYAMGGVTDDGMAGGGPMMGSNSAFDFQQHSEPVVRMADGGDTPTPKYITDMYQQVLGRAPDEGGAKYWAEQFGESLDPQELAAFRSVAAPELAQTHYQEQAPTEVPSDDLSKAVGLAKYLYPELYLADVAGDVASGRLGSNTLVNLARGITGGISSGISGLGRSLGFADGGDTTTPQSITDLYQQVLGRAPDTAGAEYWSKQFGESLDPSEIASFKAAAAPELKAAAPQMVTNMYENVLGRNADPGGQTYWSNLISSGQVTPQQALDAFKSSAKGFGETGDYDKTFAQATKPYTGFKSSDEANIVDEWVRNTLGREATDAEKQQDWYKKATSLFTLTPTTASDIYGQFQNYAKGIAGTEQADRITKAKQVLAAKGLTEADLYAQTGKSLTQLVGAPNLGLSQMQASKLIAPTTPFDFASLAAKQAAASTPSTYAPKGTTTPYGNVATPGDITRNVDDTLTVTPNIPGRPYGGFTGMQQLRDTYTTGGGRLGQVLSPTQAYTNTGASADAYNYLMGQAGWKAPTAPEFTPVKNPRYLITKEGQIIDNPDYVAPAASGGLMDAYATGGLSDAHYNLGGYSDGGRLLRGPGDGVSDSIPATIGNKQPARLADGEFVVPARIVSELGNGSTEAGARKLYAMMDRVQKARGKTVGKGRIAKNTRADKYLPA